VNTFLDGLVNYDDLNIMYLADQDEYKSISNMGAPDSATRTLVMTRPLITEKNISEEDSQYFRNIVGWGNFVPLTFDPFRSAWKSDEKIAGFLEDAHWPQSLQEVLESDQYSHIKLSGRFYQKGYCDIYLKNSLSITFELTMDAIAKNKPDFIYTDMIRDVNKVGAVCAALISGIPIVLPESMNVKDLLLMKVLSKRGSGIGAKYFGMSDERVVQFAENKETRAASEMQVQWMLYDFPVLTKRDHNPTLEYEDVMRKAHREKWDLGGGFGLKRDISRLYGNIRYSVKCVKQCITGVKAAKKSGVIPWHIKSAGTFIVNRLLLSIYIFLCHYRSIRDRFLVKSDEECPKYIICLHYFPEASTIGGVSWRNVKNEVDFLNNIEVRQVLRPDCVKIFEHPVYLVHGQRPSVFWKELKRLGYTNVVKRSAGVNLKSCDYQRLITIAGSIALESAVLGKCATLVKNSILINVEGISHITESFKLPGWNIKIEKKISPVEYVERCKSCGVRKADITEMMVRNMVQEAICMQGMGE
jgi:hypothetical protein